MKRDTRTRILVASLSLFNEHGEPNTTTNDIANEADISPGNLHYHFKKKSDLVTALLNEFQADARRVLDPPRQDSVSLDDFWAFLQELLEILAVYRFLLRDMETLVSVYPNVSHALKGFSKALTALMQLYLQALGRNGFLEISDEEMPVLCRNIVVLALFSERYDEITGASSLDEIPSFRIASSVLGMLLPYSSDEGSHLVAAMAGHYS